VNFSAENNSVSVTESKIILYADDDVDDRTWFSDACKAASQTWLLQFVETGHDVIAYLHNERLPRPSLIMLDLNMPGLDGRQTLKQLKGHPAFQHIPVVMLTTSINRIDKEVCRKLGAASLIAKPFTMGQWQQVVKDLEVFIQ